MKNLIKKGIAFLFFTSCVGLLQIDYLAKFTEKSTASTEESTSANVRKYEEALALVGQLPSAGFNNIRANLTFLSFLQYYERRTNAKEKRLRIKCIFFQRYYSE